MKKEFVMLGSACIAAGLIMFFSVFLMFGEFQTFVGELLRFFSGQAQALYFQAILSSLIGMIVLGLGVILTVYGALANSTVEGK